MELDNMILGTVSDNGSEKPALLAPFGASGSHFVAYHGPGSCQIVRKAHVQELGCISDKNGVKYTSAYDPNILSEFSQAFRGKVIQVIRLYREMFDKNVPSQEQLIMPRNLYAGP